MNKREFLDGLRTALAGEISDYEIRSNTDYYNTYIIDEVRKGRPEAEVIAELGDPSLIARTIIDTAGGQPQGGQGEQYYSQASGPDEQVKKGLHAEYNADRGFDIRYGRLKLNTWYGKLLILAIVLLVIFAVISIVTSVVSILLPILLPVVIVLLVLSAVKGNGGR